ncbi:MAG TPA: DUF4280 domain-containing protein [Polyangiaceae bacterium]|nr:DUF4280 domain-containing protein [Polyangiaceae bacterium]
MAVLVSAGTMIKCSMGAAPSSLAVLPKNRVVAGTPVANIFDNVPFLNIMPFGTCMSIANPAVAAATAAALGVLTPAPCIPATVAPWVPGVPTVLVGNMPAVDSGCQLICSFGGAISVVTPSQTAASGG